MTNQGVSSGQARGGIGFVGALTIAFIILKLCDVITWSWWWVLAPLWIATVLVVLTVAGGGALVFWLAFTEDERAKKRKAKADRARPAATALHGPVRKWGYRATPRSDAERLREDHERIWGK